ncbi:MAG: MraY family glycosyltransferase [Sediminibacterium sp.]
MEQMISSFSVLLLVNVLVEILYFQIARKFNIVDKPNERSSHNIVTIRGGGVVFPISFIITTLFFSEVDILFSLCLVTLSTASFVDDIVSLNSKVRLVIQMAAVIGLLYSTLTTQSWYIAIVFFILITGIINAYNFMDGINGITVLYSLVTLASIYWVKETVQGFLSEYLFMSILSSLMVFGFLNLRKKALCFSGDVGSISLAFIFCFLLIKMVLLTNFGWWILFLGIYGIDTVFTIICRIFRKESILQAHRSHFYQYLANEAGLTHIQVSLLYAIAQLSLNAIVIYSYYNNQMWPALISLFLFLSIYIIFRLRFEGYKRLFVTYLL